MLGSSQVRIAWDRATLDYARWVARSVNNCIINESPNKNSRIEFFDTRIFCHNYEICMVRSLDSRMFILYIECISGLAFISSLIATMEYQYSRNRNIWNLQISTSRTIQWGRRVHEIENSAHNQCQKIREIKVFLQTIIH